VISQELLASVQLIVFDFDGVFTDNTVYVNQDGIESVRCWRSDGLGITKLNEIGIQTLIISTEKNPVVTVRSHKLQIQCKQNIDDKATTVLETCRELGINAKHTMFVGNDINDIPAFKVVGIPVAVADAHPDVNPYVLFHTEKSGGYGAVREVCDLVYHAKKGTLDKI